MKRGDYAGILSNQGTQPLSHRDLGRYYIQECAPFPRTGSLSALPKNPSERILKRELREKYWQGEEQKVQIRAQDFGPNCLEALHS
jgi:hypothetical protein